MLCMVGWTTVNGFEISQPDQSDWSAKRIASYEEYSDIGPVMAVLRVPGRNIEAAVFPDSLRKGLEAGVAWVGSTSMPGEAGNIAIAGHRDSFFRRLENVPMGTLIELETDAGVELYEVDKVSIVDALDVSPLDQTGEDVISLITCHPFYYEGYAPDRYVVRARRVSPLLSMTEPAGPVDESSGLVLTKEE